MKQTTLRVLPLPIGSIVVPCWDYLIGSYCKHKPQKKTTMELMDSFD